MALEIQAVFSRCVWGAIFVTLQHPCLCTRSLLCTRCIQERHLGGIAIFFREYAPCSTFHYNTIACRTNLSKPGEGIVHNLCFSDVHVLLYTCFKVQDLAKLCGEGI